MTISMSRKLVVIGAGGHAKVVVATARAAGFEVSALYDDNEALHGKQLAGVPILGPIDRVAVNDSQLVLAIGRNETRRRIAESLGDADWATLIHPGAMVHDSAEVGAGTVIFAGAVVQPEAKIGRHAIVNTGAIIDHDGRIGDYVHLAPGTTLAGEVEVGNGTMLGIGCCAMPQVRIGCWCVIAAGAAVTASVGDRVMAAGVPAVVKKTDLGI